MGDARCKALAEVPKVNKSVTLMQLGGNNIGSNGRYALEKSAADRKVEGKPVTISYSKPEINPSTTKVRWEKPETH